MALIYRQSGIEATARRQHTPRREYTATRMVYSVERHYGVWAVVGHELGERASAPDRRTPVAYFATEAEAEWVARQLTERRAAAGEDGGETTALGRSRVRGKGKRGHAAGLGVKDALWNGMNVPR